MGTLHEAIGVAKEKERQLEKAEEQRKKLFSEVFKDWDGIKERIKGGETTGDPLKDFVIVRHGFGASEKVENRYRVVQDKLKGCQGQYIMLVLTRKDQICFRGPGEDRASDYINKTVLEMGVLDGECFIFNLAEQKFYFPTGGLFVTYPHSHFKDTNFAITENLALSFTDDIGLTDSPPLKILVGDKEVADWFAEQRGGYDKVFCELNQIFKRSVSYPRLEDYLKAKQEELSEEYENLRARKTWLEIESKRLIRLGKSEPLMEKELREIPQKITKVMTEADRLGIDTQDWVGSK